MRPEKSKDPLGKLAEGNQIMHATILDTVDSKKWDDFIMKEHYAIAWQLFEWSKLLEKHYNTKFYPIVVEKNNNIVGILPLYRIKPLKGKPRMLSVPHAVAGGMLAEHTDVKQSLLEAAIKTCSTNGIIDFTLKQYKVKVEGDLTTDDNYYNRELNLEGGVRKVWERITPENKDYVLATENETLILEYPLKEIGKFYNFLLKHHRRKGIPCVSRPWISDLVELGMYSVSILKQGNKIVAGTMIKEFKDTVSFPFTCSSGDSASDDLPVYRLYWELIKSYSKKGFKICHSGRIPKTDDVDPYRLGWGGTKYPYFYQYFPARVEQVTEFSRKRNWKRHAFTSMWRLLPLPIAESLGPYVVRQFP